MHVCWQRWRRHTSHVRVQSGHPVPAVTGILLHHLSHSRTVQRHSVLQVEHWGYQAIAVSVATGQGMAQLAQALDGRISAVAGPSGVGKSSIINALRLSAQRHPQQAEHAQQSEHAHRAEHAQQAQQAEHASSAQQAEHAHHGHSTLHQTRQQDTHGASLSSESASTAPGINEQHAPPSNRVDSNSQRASSSFDFKTRHQPHNGAEPTSTQHDTANVPGLSVTEDSAMHSSTQSQQEQSQPRAQWAQPQDEQLPQHHQQGALPEANQHRAGANASLSQDSLQPSSNQPHFPNSCNDSSSAEAPALLSHESNGAHASASSEQDRSCKGDGRVSQQGSDDTGEGVQLQSVGAMSNIGRGMHTTRHVALLKVCLLAAPGKHHMKP